MRKTTQLSIACLIAVFAFSLVYPLTMWAKPAKFKAVAFLPVNNANVAGFNIFVKKINEQFKRNDYIKISA